MTPRSVTAVQGGDIDEWLAKLVSDGTRKAYYSDLKSFYRWAVRRALLDVDPMVMTDAPRRPKHLPKPVRASVIATAVAMSDGSVQLMILLGSLAGLRIAEIAAVASEDIHIEHEPPLLMVRQGKGGKDRIVPLHPVLVERLRNVRSGWLFPSRRSDRDHIPASSVGIRVSRALTVAAEGQRITAHQLRHYFGTEAARWSNGNVVLVGGLMGHGSTQTTMGYISWTPTDGAEVVSQIAGGGRPGVTDELAARRSASAAS